MTDTKSKEVELKPDNVIAFAVSIYESQGYPKNSFGMLDRELSRRFILQAEHLIKCGYAKFGKDNSGMVPNPNQDYDNGFGHSGPCQPNCQCDIMKFSQQPPKERKVSLEEIKIIKSVLDYYNLTEDGFYTDVISEEIAKRLNATEERKGAV